AAAVSPEGRISSEDLGIWNDEHVEGLKRITNFVHAQGAVAGIQLAHSGRKASTVPPWKGMEQVKPEEGGWIGIAPSAIPYREHEFAPLETSLTDIEKVVTDFHKAAERALSAGFKVIEIHAAHGYLLHSFLSPLSNKREDDYGGPFENRIRLLLTVIKAVRTVWPEELPLFLRISATDHTEGGWTVDDSVKLATIVKDIGVDLVDCSSGGNVPSARIELFPGYQVQYAEAVRKAGIRTGAVGLITTWQQAEDILKNEQADLIFMAREMLRDPYFPMHASIALGESFPWPDQYERADPFKKKRK
ncbi:MAG: NADH:flavin oxidoreductase/NADH oxidase, partial [Chitinophagaceae bacterium]